MELMRRRLLMMSEAEALTEYQATGNPASFITDVAKPLKGLSVPFLPVQTGSGDPSPQNIRPISGKDSITIYRSGQDTSNPTSYTVVFPASAGTVYGGYVDLAQEVVVAEWKGITVSEATWYYDSSYTRFTASLSDLKQFQAVRTTPFYSTCFVPITDGRSISSVPNNAVYGASNSSNIYVKSTDYSAPTDFVSAYGNQMIVYPLASSQTFPLSQFVIPTTLKGENTIWTDTNGTNTITYLKRG